MECRMSWQEQLLGKLTLKIVMSQDNKLLRILNPFVAVSDVWLKKHQFVFSVLSKYSTSWNFSWIAEKKSSYWINNAYIYIYICTIYLCTLHKKLIMYYYYTNICIRQQFKAKLVEGSYAHIILPSKKPNN